MTGSIKTALVLCNILWIAGARSSLAASPGASTSSSVTSQTETNTNQKPAPPSPKQTKPANNTPLQAAATVNASITVEAGLLPRDSAQQLFGGWVADHFAVVQVAIGNHSRDQQFVLQDIFFDYSHWALSGLYTQETPNTPQRTFQEYQQATKPGEISSIGALEVHDGFKSASLFSPRNTWVNGLVLVGTAAGGFAFLGPTGFTQAITGYNSTLIPGLRAFWPDRTIDQQTNVLKYGFQDKMLIAKEDPGKTYAFFPIGRFLTGGLADLYRKDPAIFFNPAELFLDPTLENCTKSSWHGSHCKQLLSIKTLLMDLIHSAPGGADLTDSAILAILTSPCHLPDPTSDDKTTGKGCPLDVSKEKDKAALMTMLGVKNLMAGASLNSVRIVVSGIMTVDVETIPAMITGVSFDKQSEGASFWSDTKDKQTGVISGKYLANGKPIITAIKLPETSTDKSNPTTNPTSGTKDKAPAATPSRKGTRKSNAGVGLQPANGNVAEASTAAPADVSAQNGTPNIQDYIVDNSLVVVANGSTDSQLHFSVQFKQQIPAGATLTFQVVKASSKSVNSGDGGANISETTSSMTYDYSVGYTQTATAH
jgi:hypothetical protein